MRWIRFNYDGKATYGILEDETVKVVRGDPFNGYEESGETRAFEDVKLLVPVVPKVFYAGICIEFFDQAFLINGFLEGL